MNEESLPNLGQQTPSEGPKNLGFLAAAVVIVTAIVLLATTSLDEEIYYLTTAEAVAQFDELGETEFRLKGDVVAGSLMLREGVLNDHRFVLATDSVELTVDYTGPLPDTFADDAEVIALGRFAERDRFVAIEVVAKCPSRYEEAAPTAQGNE